MRTAPRVFDEEHKYNLVVGAGFEHSETIQNDRAKRENRIVIQATPRHRPGAGILLTDRNRIEFRWVDGVYDLRYRNQLMVDRALQFGALRFTPYASDELFYDRNHHSWNENHYAFGVQLPLRQSLMVDSYYLRQNCTTCSEDRVNVFGLTFNLYLGRRR